MCFKRDNDLSVLNLNFYFFDQNLWLYSSPIRIRPSKFIVSKVDDITLSLTIIGDAAKGQSKPQHLVRFVIIPANFLSRPNKKCVNILLPIMCYFAISYPFCHFLFQFLFSSFSIAVRSGRREVHCGILQHRISNDSYRIHI